MAFTDYLKQGLTSIQNPIGFDLSPFQKKAPVPTGKMGPVPEAAANDAARAKKLASPVNPAVTDVTKPISPKKISPASQMGAVSQQVDQGFKSALSPTDPAAIGGALMKPPAPTGNQATEAPETLKAPNRSSFTNDASFNAALAKFKATGSWATPEGKSNPSTLYPGGNPSFNEGGVSSPPSPADQMKAAQDAYLKTLAPSADVTSAEQALGGVAETAAKSMAQAQQEYADRVKAIQEQATLQPFLTGRQTQAQGQLANQLAAIQSASQAQTLPLQERLANFQAQQQAQQQQAQTAEQYAEQQVAAQKPVEVGGSLVNPQTGEVIYKGTSTAQSTASIQEYEYAKSHGYQGSYTDYQNEDANRKRLAAGGSDPDRVLSATEAQALGVPFGTKASEAYGLSPTKPLTESQAKDVTFASRAGEANSYIDNLEASVAGMNSVSFAAQVAAEPNPVGNTFVSDNIRQLRQAERNFETAVLRRESGAAISASEFATDEKKYFPRPGDDAQTLKQKAQARQTAIKSMMPANAPSASAPAEGDFSW